MIQQLQLGIFGRPVVSDANVPDTISTGFAWALLFGLQCEGVGPYTYRAALPYCLLSGRAAWSGSIPSCRTAASFSPMSTASQTTASNTRRCAGRMPPIHRPSLTTGGA